MLPHPPRRSETFLGNEMLAIEMSGRAVVTPVYARSAEGTAVVPLSLRRVANKIRALRPGPDFAYDTAARWSAEAIADQLTGVNVDILHAHFINFPARVALHLGHALGVPVTATAHAADVNLQARARLEMTVRRLDHVFSISNELRGRLATIAAVERTSVIRAAVSPLVESWTAGSSDDDLPTTTIVTVARLVEKKGIHHIPSIAKELKSRGLRFDWVVAGAGPMRDRIDELVSEYGVEDCVRLIGAVGNFDALQLIRSASIAVLLSVVASDGDADGIPVFLLEAAALGKAVVTTNAGGIDDLTHSTAATVVNTDHLGEATNALADLIGSKRLRDSNGRSMAERFNAEFSPTVQVSRYLDVWRRLHSQTGRFTR
jgi:glycosyltransferase involved in cell wall biosynthesis